MGLLLKCEHVGFGYENQDAVLDVNLEVNEGDYICIVGENGSGKSTLMKGILGLLKPTSGRIEYSEELKKAGIGYLPQQTFQRLCLRWLSPGAWENAAAARFIR